MKRSSREVRGVSPEAGRESMEGKICGRGRFKFDQLLNSVKLQCKIWRRQQSRSQEEFYKDKNWGWQQRKSKYELRKNKAMFSCN